MIQQSTLRLVAALALTAVLALALSACGGGEKTVTVTQTTPSEAGKGGGGGKPETDEGADTGAVAGYVDNVSTKSGEMILAGWAASSDLAEPATLVTAEVAGKKVAKAVPTLERQDVVEALGEPGLSESGFELRLPLDSVDCGAPAAGIEVVASLDGKTGLLPYGEGIEEAVTDSC